MAKSSGQSMKREVQGGLGEKLTRPPRSNVCLVVGIRFNIVSDTKRRDDGMMDDGGREGELG